MPAPKGDFWDNLRVFKVDLAKVKVVKGFFEETLIARFPRDYGIERHV